MVENATTNMQDQYYAHVNELIKRLTYASLNQNVLSMKAIFKELHMLTQPYIQNKTWFKEGIKKTNELLNPVLQYITITPDGYVSKKGFTPAMGQNLNQIGTTIDTMREQLYLDLHAAGLLTYKNQSNKQIIE